MIRTVKVIIPVLLLAQVLVACGWARWHRAPLEKKAEWIAEKVADKLDLTDDQKTKLNSIRDEIVAKLKESRPSHMKMGEEMIAQVRSEKIDTEAIKAKMDEMDKKRDETRNFVIDKVAEFHAILTPEQRTKAAELLEKFHSRMMKHRGR